MKDIIHAVKMLVEGVQKKINDDYATNYPNSTPPVVQFDVGKRYIKLSRVQGEISKSVHCFIDAKEGPTFGDILKAASWKAPAKHARGNVFDGSWGINSVGVYGPAYLR